MVSRRSLALVAASATLASLLALPAAAGERGWGHHRPHHHHHHRPRFEGSMHSGLPSILPGRGTYSGAISALRVRGHGTYFSISGMGKRDEVRPRPKATIIDVSSVGDPCRYQAGVCVIKP
mgnify:CR=1 FL=1